MTNIYEEVEKLLKSDENRPKWADEILFELKEIKGMLKKIQTKPNKNQNDHAYFVFVNRLRKKLRADIVAGNYPEIYYNDGVYGINFKGFIYDKSTSTQLPAYKAFEIYRFLYQNQEKIDNYVSF